MATLIASTLVFLIGTSLSAAMDSILVGKYEGEYQNGRYHGKGKITFGKNTYEGTFFNGQMHGEGKMTVAGKSLHTVIQTT